MSINRVIDIEKVIHLQMEYYSAIKNNKFMKFLGKWMYLEDIILGVVTQSQKKSPILHSPCSAPLHTHSHFLALAFPCTGAYKVCKTKGPLFKMTAD
jgi:hypothetical protein